MNIPKTAILACLLTLTSACYLGDRAATTRKVSTCFSTPTTATVSLDAAPVSEAVQLIDSYLISVGYTRDKVPPDAPDLVAAYAKLNGSGLRTVDGPRVYFRSNNVDVVFIEFGNRSGRPTRATKEMCDALKSKLASRFPAQKIWIGKE